MKYDKSKAKKWLSLAEAALPDIDKIVRLSKTQTLIIGAGVFDIYASQGWMPELKRRTGDLDLSIGVVESISCYSDVKNAILSRNYIQKEVDKAYRFYPPHKIPGALAYVDLLAHPMSENISEGEVRAVMGVGPSFSFGAMSFAMLEAFEIDRDILFPHPIGMVALKLKAFEDNPQHRLKDLADVVEMINGLVETGAHFEITEIWKRIKNESLSQFAKKSLKAMAEDESAVWDLDIVRGELLKRGFNADDLDTIVIDRINEFVDQLP